MSTQDSKRQGQKIFKLSEVQHRTIKSATAVTPLDGQHSSQHKPYRPGGNGMLF